VDPNLQGPLKNLAEALHAAISQSSEVDKALRQVREKGFHALLVLEITVALSRLTVEDESESDEDDDDATIAEIIECEEDDAVDSQAESPVDPWAPELAAAPAEQAAVAGQEAAFTIAPDDREFLRAIKIRLD
jgi:hypothetical protein